MEPVRSLASQVQLRVADLAERIAASNVVTLGVLPVALIHPSSPRASLRPILDGLPLDALVGALEWVGISRRMILRELGAGVELCDAVALLLDAARGLRPALVSAVFVRFIAHGPRSSAEGLVFAPSFVVAMATMLDLAHRFDSASA